MRGEDVVLFGVVRKFVDQKIRYLREFVNQEPPVSYQ
jgi:hypothetical protein